MFYEGSCREEKRVGRDDTLKRTDFSSGVHRSMCIFIQAQSRIFVQLNDKGQSNLKFVQLVYEGQSS